MKIHIFDSRGFVRLVVRRISSALNKFRVFWYLLKFLIVTDQLGLDTQSQRKAELKKNQLN